MTFKDYYNNLDDVSPRTQFRDQIIQECGIAYDTFYKWMNGYTGGIPKLAKERISKITGVPEEELFPVVS